jgi:hypothetical protein
MFLEEELNAHTHTHTIALYPQHEIIRQLAGNYSECDFYKLNHIYKESETPSLSTTITIPFGISLTEQNNQSESSLSVTIWPKLILQYAITTHKLPNYTTKYTCTSMHFNHLRLISSTVAVGDRPLRNMYHKLTITTLLGNQFTVKPRKTSVAKQEYRQFDTITPLLLPISHTQLFISK